MNLLADWQPIGDHHIDWGSFPVYIGSLLTAGSVALALFIILRDRRRDEQQVARALNAIGVNEAGPGDLISYYVNLHNSSESVIVQPGIIATPKRNAKPGLKALSAYMHLPSTKPLGPGVKPVTAWLLYPKEATQIKLVLFASHENYNFTLEYGDGHGNRWRRDMMTSKLQRIKPVPPPELQINA